MTPGTCPDLLILHWLVDNEIIFQTPGTSSHTGAWGGGCDKPTGWRYQWPHQRRTTKNEVVKWSGGWMCQPEGVENYDAKQM